MALHIGTGTTIVFGTAPFPWTVTDLSWDDWSAPEVDGTALADTVRTFASGEVVDAGSITFEVNFDPTQALPIVGGPSRQIDINFSGTTGAGTTHNYVSNGFVTNVSLRCPIGDKISATVRVKLTGAVTKLVT